MDFGLTNTDRKLFAKYMENEVTRDDLMRSPMVGHLVHWACIENVVGHFIIVDDKAYHVEETDKNIK